MRRGERVTLVAVGALLTLLVSSLVERRAAAQPVIGGTSNANAVKLDTQTLLTLLQPLTTIAANTQQLRRPLRVAPPGVSQTPTDPCFGPFKGNVAISQTASTRLVPGAPGQRIFVCYARVVAGAAEIPSFTEGTGANCGTSTLAVSGSTTAANGESYAANGGFSGGVGLGTVMATLKQGNDLCLAQSGSNRLAGNITYVQAP